MKPRFWLGVMTAVMVALATAQAQTTQEPSASDNNPPAVSSAVAEVIKMAEGGTSEDVLLAYVQDSSASFDLSADQILYLRDIGLSSGVISAMLNRDAALRSQTAEQTDAQPATAPVAPAEAPPSVAPTPEVAQAPAPVYVANPPEVVSCFYNDLAPYGTWIQLDGAGWCWQPRVVVFNRSWRPYCDSGRWVYTDAGWFWQSDYSWGWAPFHYGRWFLREGCGWVWAPDRVWSPAWVTWRYEGDHCGWAPLPPHADFDLHLGYCFNGVHVGFDFDFGLRPEHFTFISLHDFGAHDYSPHRLPPAQVTRIFNRTTVINNYVVNNNTIVNRGIRVDRVASATHSQIHQLPIHDVPTWSSGPGGRGVTRTEVAVYRPQLRPVARPVNMVAQRIDERHPMIQHLSLASPTPARPSARPGAAAFAGHPYSTVESKRVKPQPASKPNVGQYSPGASHSAYGTAPHSYSAVVDRAAPNNSWQTKAATESGRRSVPGGTRWSGVPGNAYNSPHFQASREASSHFAEQPDQRLHTSTQNRSVPQNWLAEQSTRPAAAQSRPAPSRQPPVQLAPQAQRNAQPSWSRRETTPFSVSAGANQPRRSAPVTSPQDKWQSPIREQMASQQRQHMAQFYGQNGTRPGWPAQPSPSSRAFAPGYAKSPAQPPGQFSAKSHPSGGAPQTRANPYNQNDSGGNFHGDAYPRRQS